MIIDKIIFDNFGVYRGRQEIVLTPPSLDKPIILFGGLNGAGKTTLLDGVHLAFYGKNAHCSNRGDLSYESYLRETIHRGASPKDGAGLEVHFRRIVEGEEHTYSLHRSWSENGKGMKELVEVGRDGAIDPLLSEGWNEYIESYVPNGISKLFFFDGEQIKSLAEGKRSAELLSTAIHSLLGLDLVDRLTSDLFVLERRKLAAARNDKSRQQIEALELEISNLELLEAQSLQESASAQNELDRRNKALKALEECFQLEGGELFLRRAEIERIHAQCQNELHEKEHTIRELLSGPAPLLLLQHTLDEVEKQILHEVEVNESHLLANLFAKRDARLLKAAKTAKASQAVLRVMTEFCEKDRQERKHQGAGSCYLNAKTDLADEIHSLRRSMLPQVQKQARDLSSKVVALGEEIARLDQQLESVPDQDALAKLQREISKTKEQTREAEGRVETLKAKTTQIQRELEQKRNVVSKELEANVEVQFQQEDDGRILQHARKVRDTLVQFRGAVVRKHASKIERLMLECFWQLLRKTSLIKGIKITPETFSLELTGGDGQVLAADRLSAGERQLLATSMLWGLARASGRPLPTIIDTPLGRLDSSHRAHLVERYFPEASHQVILLSTDEEIDEGHLESLKDSIGRTYRLVFDNDTRSTHVEAGYFW